MNVAPVARHAAPRRPVKNTNLQALLCLGVVLITLVGGGALWHNHEVSHAKSVTRNELCAQDKTLADTMYALGMAATTRHDVESARSGYLDATERLATDGCNQ